MKVLTDRRPSGAVVIREISRSPDSDRFRVRGWGGGHGQYVRFAAQFFQAFLLAHAEAVFFVDDDQPETLEAHIFLQQAMGADDNVHRSVGKRRQYLALIGRTAEA